MYENRCRDLGFNKIGKGKVVMKNVRTKVRGAEQRKEQTGR